MKKNNSGFSLVELIVVIAIMAILAGIAVPTYAKYIKEANDAKALVAMDEAKTSAQTVALKDQKVAVTKIEITVTAGSGGAAGTVAVTLYKTDADGSYKAVTLSSGAYSDYMDDPLKEADFTDTSYAKGAVWEASVGKWVAK